MRYGFVGLGHLGRHLAVNLARGGFELGVFDLDRSAAQAPLEAGAAWKPSVAELARTSDALITCLPSPAATAAVLEAGAAGDDGGQRLDRDEHQRLRGDRAPREPRRRKRYRTLACPVTGGVHRAEAGDITVLVGGPQQLFDTHAAALRAMGGRVIHLGGHRASGGDQSSDQHACVHPSHRRRRGPDALCQGRGRPARRLSRPSPRARATASCTRPRAR